MATTREQRANETRRRMTAAACTLFSERGYAATTMGAVAEEAGVAVQTTYFTFRNKAALLQAAFEHAVLGPDEVPPHLSDWYREARSAPDVETAVRIFVDGNFTILQRVAPLAWVMSADRDGRATSDYNEGLRRDGFREHIEAFAAKHPLRDGLSPERALDVLLVLVGPHQFQLFVGEYGWDLDEYRDWVVAVVLRELFAIG